MLEFIAVNMAPIMFASLIIFLLLGYPVAFALAANGLLFFWIGVELAPFSGGTIHLSWPLLNALPDRFWGVMSNDTLLAIPFFTFMGIVLERSGMAEDLLDTVGQLFGPVRGGLAYAVIFVGALLAATTGVVAASVIAMGLISLPIMLRYGYDRRVASGVIAASGTLAQIIPPSLVLIVLADQLGRSVGDMYAGALIPGLVLTGLYMLYVLIMSIVKPNSMPALPKEARSLGSGVTSLLVALLICAGVAYAAHVYLTPAYGENADILGATVGVAFIYAIAVLDKGMKLNVMSRLAQQVIIVLIPPLALIFLVLGTIFLGIATPTEGGAMGAVGALIMAAAKGRLNMEVIRSALTSTTRLSAFVLFILIGSRVFSLTFYGVNGHLWVEHLLVSLPGGKVGFLIAVNILVFVLAFFLDFFELAFIIVPLLAPAAEKLGIDLIWFGVLLGVNMQTSFMHPPFGFALFYLRSVAARVPYLDRVTGKQIAPVTTGQIYWGSVPFVGIQILMVALTIMFPQMVMHYKGAGAAVDPNSIKIEVPGFGVPGQNNGNGLPGLQLPGGNPFDGKPADQGGGQQNAPANDLSQPPSFN
ncbi:MULTISPECIES: TRAP transporter large permease subunit [unclassified Rhizobium]|uniref:TRAP transporter large permease n=1 Tax=unclassified Rhizobium TaxID=2613769 RepID=UPI000DDFFE5A|nr:MULTISPECIES: TRAP transporter large permease subunit [unclassified Rhizobium]MBB3288284.1 TRAP-type mannitol/chloroaromatic compound transport system permease large subunit [Rhizobium sp. BK252]MBB3402853.1 TRAP-type mannitol/chloroaromatic compound transport system permease large subunit [Rhizobium sp. BK289]MBB3415430.1 TRAP-type mannitol/chloroaromatic compound transport system permease large subunit [Rhizobium sp. BK284]MBB3483490.1 TRAP-type mannitol/chloroaromatic compound transport s